MSSKNSYKVFVREIEATEYYTTLENALELAKAYEEAGYTEVRVEARTHQTI